jgi:hypothetical protein
MSTLDLIHLGPSIPILIPECLNKREMFPTREKSGLLWSLLPVRFDQESDGIAQKGGKKW